MSAPAAPTGSPVRPPPTPAVPPVPAPVASPTPPPAPPSTAPIAPAAHRWSTHVRATVILLALTLVMSGFAYPAFVTEVAHVLDPSAADGSLLYYPNGTVAGSALIAQNTTAPNLFWERVSLTGYNMSEGADTPYGPSDPALAAWFNETIAYLNEYGNTTVNASLPLWFVSPSASDVDPDLTPGAVLVQVPRVAQANNLSIAVVTNLVNQHITNPIAPFVGVAFVNVLELDLALVELTGED